MIFKVPRKRWVLLVALGAALAVAVPVAWATFNDVPPSNAFYDDINAIQGAGITSGCGGGNFCPTDNITRQAEAAFAHRGLPRIAFDESGGIGLTSSSQDIASVSLTAGGISGGTGFVKVVASIGSYITSTTGCPCMAGFRIAEDGSTISFNHYTTNDSVTSGGNFGGFGIETGALQIVVPVSTGTTHTFTLRGERDGGTGAMVGFGDITAEYIPFGSGGAASLGVSPSSPGPAHSPISSKN
jgi:S-layer homology domain